MKFYELEILSKKENDLIKYLEIKLLFCLRGGKGGFGSLLRSMGKALKRFTNFGAQRDLQGRRIRDIKAEKDLDQWLNEHKPVSHDKIKRFQDAKKRDCFLGKKICPFGNNCFYMWKCKLIHPPKTKIKIKNQKYLFLLNNQKDSKNSFKNLNNQIDFNKFILEGLKGLRKKKKDNIKFQQINKYNTKETLIQHSKHEHKLKFGVRKFVYLICDQCGCYFNGASWFCKDGCDFDLCLFCSFKKKSEVKPKVSCLNKIIKRKKKLKYKSLEKKFSITFEVIHIPINLLWIVSAPTLRTLSIMNENEISKSSTYTNEKLKNFFQVDLTNYSSPNDLKKIGLKGIKDELLKYGLKCGGTLKQRAERLFLIKQGIRNIPKKIFFIKNINNKINNLSNSKRI